MSISNCEAESLSLKIFENLIVELRVQMLRKISYRGKNKYEM